MKKSILPAIILSVFILQAQLIFSQVPLDTFLGEDYLPADDEPICPFPIYPDVTPDLEGPFAGTLVHDFKLYTLEGDSVQLSGILNDRKPVLLIGCNYTCFVFRGKINLINNVKEYYGDAIKIYLVYTVEAHPVIDVSPYFGVEAVGDQNYADGILYRQPTTYGERKAIVSDMLAAETINVPVLIDGPCNNWWLNFGTAPNCAFLIDPDGYVFDDQNWFNKEPENIYASVDSLLGICGTGTFTPTGTFTAVKDEDDETYYGTAGNVITAHFTLTNTSDDDVLIDFRRLSNDIPSGWLSYICTELCFSPDADSTTVYLAPGESETVRTDFYTDDIPASADMDISFTNTNDATNTYSYSVHAESIAAAAVSSLSAENFIHIYPDPVQQGGNVIIEFSDATTAAWQLFNAEGKIISAGNTNADEKYELPTENIAAGVYFFHVSGREGSIPVVVQ